MYLVFDVCVFFFKQKTAYEMRISDWSSDVCSSDLVQHPRPERPAVQRQAVAAQRGLALGAAAQVVPDVAVQPAAGAVDDLVQGLAGLAQDLDGVLASGAGAVVHRSEEHTSELQSLMRISYAVFCLQKQHKQARKIRNTMENRQQTALNS